MLARGDANQGPARSWWHLGCAGTAAPWGGAEVWCAGATSLAPCLQVHGQKAAWEDPVEWVRDTLPWPSAQQDQSKLYHLPPPTIGPHSTVSPPEERTVKDTTPSSLDADPLVWPWCAGCWEGEGWCWWGGPQQVQVGHLGLMGMEKTFPAFSQHVQESLNPRTTEVGRNL